MSEVCGLGLCAVYFGVFLFPRFYGYIELTPYIYMYIFSILLVPGWHLECPHGPHHLFFQNLPVQKVRYSKQKVFQNYISCIADKSFCVLYIYLYIYIYLSIYLTICLSIYMCLCLDAGIIHRKLAGSTKSSGQTGFRSTEICQKGSQHCGGFG